MAAPSRSRKSPDRPPGRSRPPGSLAARWRRVRLFLCDVDGVLTDATLGMGPAGEMKFFHIQDGLGLRLLQRCGLRVGWVSSRPSPATTLRAADLNVDFLHQGSGGKVEAVAAILAQAGVGWAEICYVGDDLVDLGVMRRAGVAVAVANAVAEVKAVADLVTRRSGGQGAVREVVERLLRAQGRWAELVAAQAA